MPHYENLRKKRRYEKNLLSGHTSSLLTGYELVIAVDGGHEYIRTDVPLQKVGHKVDIFQPIQYISKVIERKNHQAAMREGGRFGSVVSCRKISTEDYLKRIEHLNIIRFAPTMEIIDSSITVKKGLEAQQPEKGKPFTIEIIKEN